jgi:hypothetical protein
MILQCTRGSIATEVSVRDDDLLCGLLCVMPFSPGNILLGDYLVELDEMYVGKPTTIAGVNVILKILDK